MNDSIRELPNSRGVEKAVLSVVMQNPDRIDELSSLTTQHFYCPSNQIIFNAIKATLNEGRQLELVTFVDRLLKLGMLDACGGASEIASLNSYCPTTVNMKDHVEIINEAYARRIAIEKAQSLTESAYTENIEEVTKIANQTATEIESTLNSETEGKTLKEILRESFNQFQSRTEGKTDSMGIPTIDLIDQYLKGAHGGRIWVIGAYPGGGKSIIASQMILNAIQLGYPCAYISLEMPERDIMDRMLVQSAGIESRAFTDPIWHSQVNGGESVKKRILDAIKGAAVRISKSPLQIFKPKNSRLRTVLGLIRKTVRENKTKMLALDYVQLISDDALTSEAKLANISHALQQIAGELDITILLLTQLNAEGETKHGRVIEEDADAFLSIIQDRNKESETYKRHRYILISKDRHYGNNGERIKLIFNREKIIFEQGEDETEAAKTKTKPTFKR